MGWISAKIFGSSATNWFKICFQFLSKFHDLRLQKHAALDVWYCGICCDRKVCYSSRDLIREVPCCDSQKWSIYEIV